MVEERLEPEVKLSPSAPMAQVETKSAARRRLVTTSKPTTTVVSVAIDVPLPKWVSARIKVSACPRQESYPLHARIDLVEFVLVQLDRQARERDRRCCTEAEAPAMVSDPA